ncbi:BrnT family toxin [Halochromatium roseum]|uniref:BrnT family toxin n=1 Tax=Halochromatium roseum TaxID=391920 RepID=UPI0019142E50|nr:BrnT family toxin [Halochromatium roseum]MBK5938327.1 hypothetical protein [Halochromatium roseum]
MRFTWQEQKRRTNLAKHGFDFASAEQVFSGHTFSFEDQRYAYDEQRFITVGLLGINVVVMVHTETADEIHIISMRKAEKHEQQAYFRSLRGKR